jgi:hypothetical protein
MRRDFSLPETGVKRVYVVKARQLGVVDSYFRLMRTEIAPLSVRANAAQIWLCSAADEEWQVSVGIEVCNRDGRMHCSLARTGSRGMNC